MRQSSSLFSIAELLSERLDALGLRKKVREQSCLLVWNDVVGPGIANAAQPEYIRDGILFVVTKSSVWSNELSFLKHDIIKALNRKVGGRAIRDIVLRVGKVAPARQASCSGEVSAGVEGIPLSNEEIEQVESMARIAGAARDDVRTLLRTVFQLERWKRSRGWVPCQVCGSLQNTLSGVCPVCAARRLE